MTTLQEVRTLAKGERLPKYKYKQFMSMSARDFEYYLWDENEKLVGVLYQPRHSHMLRKFKAAN